MDKRVLNVDEAAELLGIGRSKAYELVRTGALKSITLGRRRLIPLVAVDELLGFPAPTFPIAAAPEPEGSRKPVAWVEGGKLVIDAAAIRSLLWPGLGRWGN